MRSIRAAIGSSRGAMRGILIGSLPLPSPPPLSPPSPVTYARGIKLRFYIGWEATSDMREKRERGTTVVASCARVSPRDMESVNGFICERRVQKGKGGGGREESPVDLSTCFA